MAKQKDNPTTTQTTPATPAITDTTGNQAAPEKRKRTPSVKYTKIRESGYKLVDGKEPINPLDRLIEVHRGGISFPGVEFETNILGFVAKIPARGEALKNPTMRDLFKVLVELFDQPTQ